MEDGRQNEDEIRQHLPLLALSSQSEPDMLPTALADTLRWTAVFRLEYFIQENLTWQSDSHVGAVCSMSSLGPTLAMSLRGAGW